MLINVLMAFLLMFPEVLIGKNMEVSSLMSLLKYTNKDTLFIVDIDNTLIESSQHMGSIQWSDYLASEYAKQGKKTYEEVDRFVSDYWCSVQPYIKVRCVDPATPELLKKLNELGIRIIGLTARRPSELEYTLEQLSSVNIELSNELMSTSRLEIILDKEPALYDKGILFCTPTHDKSTVLEIFLNHIGYFPKEMIFCDDKLHNVLDLEKLAKKRGAKYIGVRFSGSDVRVKNFDPAIANFQYDCLPAIVSDEEAKEMLITKDLILSYLARSRSFEDLSDPYR